MSISKEDIKWMQRCLALAKQAEGKTASNPMVGCVIVDQNNNNIAEAYHQYAGSRHAEAEALALLDGNAQGCTMYVNLEPCHHKNNRRMKEPCTSLIAQSGVCRVVVGVTDPIAEHSGGALWLEQQQIEVINNVLESECKELNRPFFVWADKHRPQIVLKIAMSLDGKITKNQGSRTQLTGQESQTNVHECRKRFDAILVGIETVLIDDPKLTVRHVTRDKDPIRIVLDSQLKMPSESLVLPHNSDSDARMIVACTTMASDSDCHRLEQKGAEIWGIEGNSKSIDLHVLSARLGHEGLLSVLVEGGALVHQSFLTEGLVDDVLVYIAPTILGGSEALSWISEQMCLSQKMSFSAPPKQIGDDILINLRLESS